MPAFVGDFKYFVFDLALKAFGYGDGSGIVSTFIIGDYLEMLIMFGFSGDDVITICLLTFRFE